MTPLVIIPARGGSKGIPGKNIKPLGGKPLIHYAIDLAREICDDSHILVSTDSEQIAQTAQLTGLEVGYRRPPHLATDTAGSREVMLDAMDWADAQGINYDCVLLLQPTSPFRNLEDVKNCLKAYTPELDMVTTVVAAPANPFYDTFSINRQGFLEIAAGDGRYTRRQDAPQAFQLNGAVYVINPKSLREKHIGQFEKRLPVEMPQERSLDLDTLADWARAEELFASQQRLGSLAGITKELTAEEYNAIFPQPLHAFNSTSFNQLNQGKCDQLKFLALCDAQSKPRLGLVAGVKGHELKAPFSAPFAGFDFRKNERVDKLQEALRGFRKYLADSNLVASITLPPNLYWPEIGAKINMLLGNPVVQDINYHYPLNQDRPLSPAARRNLNTAIKSSFELEIHSANDISLERAYKVVKANHDEHGYPVHMSLSDLIATSAIIPMDVFLLTQEGQEAAAAIIYHTTDTVVQLIYWGDLSRFRAERPMNLLAHKIIDFYRAAEKEIFDLGPASQDGIPAAGLCEFKEGMGCLPSLKCQYCL